MKLYGIGGLGADRRVFQDLHLDLDFECIDWISPMGNESIEHYSKRLLQMINVDESFALLGGSFGGLVAVEICKIITPKVLILVSSAEVRKELHPMALFIGKLKILKFLPVLFFKPPKQIVRIVFDADNKNLLYDILRDTDPQFVKWALNELTSWENIERVKVPILKLIGDKDRLFPPLKASNSIFIDRGGHFMIVDRAKELSKAINQFVSPLH